jgi:phytoene desaturase
VVGAETVAGERFPASAVIANLDAATVYGRLLPPEGRIRRRASRLAAMPPSCSAFALLLGVEGQHPDLAHHNVFFSADYRREFDEIFRLRRPPEYPTVYAAITSKSDPGHAPSGCENWFVLVNVPAAEGGYDWGRRSDEYAGLILRRLADFDLDLGGRIRVRKLITPLDLERLSGARGGSLYGASFNDRLAPLRRPGNRCPEVAGLYLAGGTTHPGGGIPLVLLSGRLAARMICGVE